MLEELISGLFYFSIVSKMALISREGARQKVRYAPRMGNQTSLQPVRREQTGFTVSLAFKPPRTHHRHVIKDRGGVAGAASARQGILRNGQVSASSAQSSNKPGVKHRSELTALFLEDLLTASA